jgi:hypothetical protein
MDKKTVIGTVGASLTAAALFVGTVAAGVSAQAPPTTSTTPAAQPTAVPKSTAVPGENPKPGRPFPGGHHGSGGFGGFGDFGGKGVLEGPFPGGKGGFVPNADMANGQITKANEFLTLARGDLTYATGKMDTANVQKWLNSADALLKSARSAVTDTKYERASLNAQAAIGLIGAAEGQMAHTLGADKLPSASQFPMGRKGHMEGMPGAATATITQAQASRILAQTYNNLVAQKALIKSTDATVYLTDAQNAYKTAHDAYNAGKYNDAVVAARVAGQLAGVARTVQAAANAPDSPDTVVPVPGPTF